MTIPTLPITSNYDDWLTLFEYDPNDPLNIEKRSERTMDGVAVKDIVFGSPTGGKVSAFLIVPPGEGPFAGIIFFHWYETQAATNNRSQFIDEAVALAKQGTVSLLIQGKLPWLYDPIDYETDRLRIVKQVINLMRSIDLLTARPDVDSERIGFVGHDFGAMYGAVMAGIDHRLKACIFMAGTSRFSNWFLPYWMSSRDIEYKEEYREYLNPVEPINYFGHIAPATIFFQFGSQDIYYSEEIAQEQFDAASEPKSMTWYDVGHELNDLAQNDRIKWMAAQLDLNDEL